MIFSLWNTYEVTPSHRVISLESVSVHILLASLLLQLQLSHTTDLKQLMLTRLENLEQTDRTGDKGFRRFGVLGKTMWRLEHLYRLIGVDIIKRGFAGYLFVRTGASNEVKGSTGKVVSLDESDDNVKVCPW